RQSADTKLSGAAESPRMPVSEFDRYWWLILRHKSLPSLLHFEDRNSMAFSVEARVPFLGRGISEFAMTLPTESKLRGGWTKAVLRDALRGRVPDAILNRPDKIGFAAPTLRWMQRPLRQWWRDTLASTACRQRGWINPSQIDPLARRTERGNGRAALMLWRLAIAEHWAQRMLDALPKN